MMTGKGIMIWKGKHYGDGSIAANVQACKEMGLSWVALKIGDGIDKVNYACFPGQMTQAVRAFRDAGMDVIGWHYVYGGVWWNRTTSTWMTNGATPAQEAAFAQAEVKALGLSAYWIDAEKEYKVINPDARAKSFMDNLKGIGVPVGLNSYRFPSLHPTFPAATFLAGCDHHAPQVYHMQGRGVIDLERSMGELKKLKDVPFLPVGRAYVGDGYGLPGITPAEMLTFTEAAQSAGCPGISWWALDFLHLHDGGGLRKDAIAVYKWGDLPTEPAPAPIEALKVIGKVRITAPVLNIRKGASVSYADIGDTMRGAEWYVFELSNGWARIGASTWIKVDGYAELEKWVAAHG